MLKAMIVRIGRTLKCLIRVPRGRPGFFSNTPYELPRIGQIRREKLIGDLFIAHQLFSGTSKTGLDVQGILDKLRGERVLWSDLYVAEVAILNLLEGPRLQQRARDLHSQLQRFLGDVAYATYRNRMQDPFTSTVPSVHSEPRPADAEVRANAESVASRLYDLYSALHERDERRSTLSLSAAVLIGIVMMLLYFPIREDYRTIVKKDGYVPAKIVLTTPVNSGDATRTDGATVAAGAATDSKQGSEKIHNAARPSDAVVVVAEQPAKYQSQHDVVLMISAVLASGAAGGFVSFQRRIQQVNVSMSKDEWLEDAQAFTTLLGLGHVVTPVMLALTSGALFAVIINLVFSTAWVTGTLFPRILTANGETSSTLIEYVLNTVVPGKDVAKLLLWSFIAGFAERLVPDMIDAIAARAGPPGQSMK